MLNFTARVVGARHRPETALKLAMELDPTFEVWLEREPHNKFDSNAIKVMVNYNGDAHHIGYVPKTDNSELAAAMDEGRQFTVVAGGHASYYEPEIEIIEVDAAPEAA